MTLRRAAMALVCVALLAAALWRSRASRNPSTAPEAALAATFTPAAQSQHAPNPTGADVILDVSSVAVPPGTALGDLDMARRPPPAIAAQNATRSSDALFLRQLNLDEATIDRFANGNEKSAIEDLTGRAATGDPAAVAALGAIAVACHHQPPGPYFEMLAASKKKAARALPAADDGWFESRVDLDLAESMHDVAICDSLEDLSEIKRQLGGLAHDADAAAEWVLSADAPAAEATALLRESALQSFAPAEFQYAKWVLENPSSVQSGDPTALDMLRHAADSLPEARAFLAACEMTGCAGIESDFATAAVDARVAAEQGSPDALIGMSKQLPLSVVSVDEPEAWTLFKAALELRGCGNPDLNVEWMKAVGTAFSVPAATPAARQLAEQYWQRYGAGAMANLGC